MRASQSRAFMQNERVHASWHKEIGLGSRTFVKEDERSREGRSKARPLYIYIYIPPVVATGQRI